MGGGNANSSPSHQNGHHFADDILKWIFMNENFCILIKISLKFVPEGPIDKKSVLVQIIFGSAPSHYLNQWWPVHWHIYVALGEDELIGRLTHGGLKKNGWHFSNNILSKSDDESTLFQVANSLYHHVTTHHLIQCCSKSVMSFDENLGTFYEMPWKHVFSGLNATTMVMVFFGFGCNDQLVYLKKKKWNKIKQKKGFLWGSHPGQRLGLPSAGSWVQMSCAPRQEFVSLIHFIVFESAGPV